MLKKKNDRAAESERKGTHKDAGHTHTLETIHTQTIHTHTIHAHAHLNALVNTQCRCMYKSITLDVRIVVLLYTLKMPLHTLNAHTHLMH